MKFRVGETRGNSRVFKIVCRNFLNEHGSGSKSPGKLLGGVGSEVGEEVVYWKVIKLVGCV